MNQTVYHHAGQMPVEEVYRIKRAWTTRLTSWHFGLISAVASVLALIPAYMTFEPLVQAVSGNRGLDQAPAPTVVGLVTFIGFLLLATGALGLRRVTRHRLLCLSRWSWLPAIATMDGRFALVRLATMPQPTPISDSPRTLNLDYRAAWHPHQEGDRAPTSSGVRGDQRARVGT